MILDAPIQGLYPARRGYGQPIAGYEFNAEEGVFSRIVAIGHAVLGVAGIDMNSLAYKLSLAYYVVGFMVGLLAIIGGFVTAVHIVRKILKW